jgi:hypothetical protein
MYTSVYSFTGPKDGYNPYAGVIQANDGALYGTTYLGGQSSDYYDDGYGTVFRIVLSPTIFSQPTNQTVVAGGDATFLVGATGFAPLGYQWQRNGLGIPGATNNSLLLTGVTAADAGNYSVAIRNAGGITASANALLTVLCPTITNSAATLPIAILGNDYSQTITFTGGAEPYTVALIGGWLPPGLTLSKSGILSGTPTNSGNYAFALRATDLYLCNAVFYYNLSVFGISLASSFVDGNGLFRAQVLGPPERTLVVLASTNVDQPLTNWTAITMNVSSNGVFDFVDTNIIGTTNWPQRFYRVKLAP